MKAFTLFLSILFLASCSNPNTALEKELNDTKTKLIAAEQALAESSKPQAVANEDTYPLVHLVYFKVKSDSDQVKLIEEINKLEGIEVLHDLEVGSFEDLGDQRALSDYQVVMQMSFKSEADYKTYQAHPIHLALKENAKSLLAGPPATYDYLKK